jgi:hypothetical protein
MILEDWLAAIAPSQLNSLLKDLSDRKLHLLTSAFLRRVWDALPSHQTHTAVEATERFVDGLLTVGALSRLRSIDLLESCESLWLDPDSGEEVQELIGRGEFWYDERAAEYEAQVAKDGYILRGVQMGVKRPRWIAVQAAFWARESVAWAASRDGGDSAELKEATAQFHLFREIVGDGWPVDPRWPQWRTDTVRLVALGIHRSQMFDQLPILADALQDAGCDDETVLSHCREVTEHARGCWVLDLAMGVS